MMWQLGPNAVVSASCVGPLHRAVDSVFENFRTDPARDDGSIRPLELDARMDGSGALQLFASGAPIVRAESAEALAPLLEGSLLGYAVRTRRDAAAFHAGSVVIEGRGVMMLGPKGSGKSTLSLYLAKNGANYLSDELALVRFEDAKLLAFPKSVTVKQGAFHLFPELSAEPTHQDPVRGPIRYYRARSGAVQEHPVDLIVLPRFNAELDAPRISKLSPSETALELVQQAFGGLERGAPRTLDLVGRLAMVPAIRLEFPSCGSAEEAIVGALREGR